MRPSAAFWAALSCSLAVASGCGSRTSLNPGHAYSDVAPSEPDEGEPVSPRGGAPSLAPMQPPMSVPPMVQPPVSVPPVMRPPIMQPPMTEPPVVEPPDACELANVSFAELRPTVTLLVDQSGSMREGYPTQESDLTRWSMVRQALLDPKTGVVPSMQQSIQFGLVLYTSHNGFSTGACPVLSEVQSATNNYKSIRALYDAVAPDDDTPTGPALQQVVRSINETARKGPEVILLVTDGDPDTCEVPDPQEGQPQAIAGAAAAHTAGIDLYVLGISTDISGDKLQQLANAGQGKRLDAIWGVDSDAAEPFQASTSVAGFTAQLKDILANVPLCEIELTRSVLVEELDEDSVELDGKPLRYGSPDGFELTDSRHLEVVGKACESLRAAGKRLTVRVACAE